MAQKSILIILIIIGIFLRIYQINQLPAGLFSDEISIAVNIKTIAENGTDEYGRRFPFAFESLSDYKMPGYIYLSVIPYKIFGQTILSVRFIALISGILSIFLIGYLASSLFPEKKMLPYYAMLVLSLCLYHIHFSRIAYETMLSTTFLLIYLIAFWKALNTPHNKGWVCIGAVAILLSLWSYYAARFIIPIFTLCFTLYLFVSKSSIKKKELMTIVSIFLCITFLAFLPSFFGSKIDKRPLSYLLTDTDGTGITAIFGKIRTIAASWLWIWNFEFLFDKGDLFAYRHGTKENGIFMNIFMIPYIVGIWYLIRNISRKTIAIVFLFLFSIFAGLPSALTNGVPYAPRLLPMVIPLTIIIALGIDHLYNYLYKQKRVYQFCINSLIVIILLYEIASFSHIYFNHFKINSLPEFPKASVDMSKFVGEYSRSYPERTIFFLGGKSCRNWGHDDLHLWYFGNMDNQLMIKWNNLFREERYTASSPFDAYDALIQPRYSFKNIIMNPDENEITHAKSRSLVIRCGIHKDNINPAREKIIRVYYQYEYANQDPFYVASLIK